MFPPDADVIIVGAGPAGSMAAFELSRKGISVLLLEKSEIPRYKVCGGGLTHKIVQEIPFDLRPVIERDVFSIIFSRNFSDIYKRTSPDPLIYCTMRSDLDEYLVQMAIGEGAVLKTGQQVVNIEESGSGVVVTTKKSRFSGRLLIGAEGASGIVSRKLNLKENITYGVAWEAEILSSSLFNDRFRETVFLDWGTIPGGYGWAFPKKDHFSVGVGGPSTLSGLMMPYYQKFLDHIGGFMKNDLYSEKSDESDPKFQTLSLKSWPIPVRTSRSIFHSRQVLVAGDAAGLTDPLTGEGIYYAVRSGKIAAMTCLEYLSGQVSTLSNYSQKINDELMTELLEARKIKDLFNTFPGKIHFFVRDNDRAWRAFGKILRGERWYVDVRNGFGHWRIFWNLACSISKWISLMKEKNWERAKKKTRLGYGGPSAKVRKHQSSV